jgi:MtrB/PioB family decaheme-associated outer membrane protein
MKTRNGNMRFSVLAIAVAGALTEMYAMPAQADDEEVKALITPTNFVEIGASNTSRSSAKFGEYNGLNKDGVNFVGNFDVSGGNAHGDGNGVRQWEITGRDLGLSSREFGATISDQGQWNIGIGYDELRHNISDTYQTPQQGSMGGNNFTLPTNFRNINGAAPSARVLTATQLGAFHTEDVGTTRKNTSFGAGYIFDKQWSVKFDYNHLDQSGAKLIGTGAQGLIPIVGGSTSRAEAVNILMNPTNYKTDTFNLALNWVGDKGHLTGGYYGSIFRDGYNSLSWQNPMTTGASACVGAACFTTNTMSTAPDNSFHQLNLSGGYAFSSSTKLAGGLSYGRNTQDDSYASAVMQVGGLPQSSLNGLVVNTHADLKLTNQTTKDLMLSAGFKYNERDNRTASDIYRYVNIANVNYSAVNTPYSNKKTQYEVAADYRLVKGQNLRLTYEHEDVKRWCDNVANGASCVASPSSNEDKLGLGYRLKASDSIKLNAGYTYAKRNASWDHNYVAQFGATPLTTGVNGGDRLGFAAYPYASRQQDILKAGVNWQATEQLDLGLNGRYSKDNYDTTLGVQDGRTVSINLDATYTYSENGSVSAYASWQNAERNLRSGNNGSVTVAPTNIWTNKLAQDDTSVGFNAKHGGLMGGKLELLGDVSYSFGKSGYSTQVPYLATCSAATSLTCGSTPDIKSTLIAVKFTGTYSVDKRSKVALAYLYQKLTSDDYFYNTYQYGYTPNRVVPTNEQAPNYSVNLIAATYIYNF